MKPNLALMRLKRWLLPRAVIGRISELVIVFVLLTSVTLAQDATPIPTLIPPTLVPATSSARFDGVPTESAIARIVRDGVVRVGAYYNEPPFASLDIRGNVAGFDADLARSMATAWGVNIEFVQVTRQTNIDLLAQGVIDLLISAQPHTRELDSRVEFSQSYFPAVQALLVREGDGATLLEHMADRQIGVVVGTRGERAAEDWKQRSPYTFNIQRFFTLNEALAALDMQGVDGVVSNRTELTRLLIPGNQRFVDVPINPEPFAVGMRRFDGNLRQLVNRTLQYLFLSGRLNEIHEANFNGEGFPSASFAIWDNVGETAPTPAQSATDIPLLTTYAIRRMQTERALRVAGLRDLPADAPESERRLDAVNRALVNGLAARWQVNLVPVPDNGQSPIEIVAAGGADLAVGIQPDWTYAGQVDFTSHYLVRGFRLMVREADNFRSFGDLRGKVIGIFQTDANVRDLVGVFAERERALVDDFFSILREQDAAFTMLSDNNASVVFGDSLKLIPNVESSGGQLELTTNSAGQPLWYTRDFIGIAVPRNDVDFRLLVEYTLQDMYSDGTLGEVLRPVMLPGETPQLEVWHGLGALQGAMLGG